MNKNDNTRGAASVTTRLRDSQLKTVKAALFFSGLFALALAIWGFFYINDAAYLGNYNIFTFWNGVGRSFSFSRGDIFLPDLTYTATALGKAPHVVNASEEFYFLILAIVMLGLLHGLIELMSRAGASLKIRRQLDPLYKMARRALELSDESAIHAANGGAEKLHGLESAIESMSGVSPDAALHTGDGELRGIEDAINGLLARTRDSYSQQTRFVSDASHELRTPIAVMKGYTDLLARWGKDDEKILDESIVALKAETEHMNTLVEQLLFLARGDSGRTKLTLEPISLTQLLREVYEESVMIDPKHVWTFKESSPVEVNGDLAMLKQAIRILADNAAKYTPEGGEISLRAMTDASGAPVAVIQDSGIGISPESLPHIFERFYRADSARGSTGGSGLGLSIARWIVERHGGYFDVASLEDVGTRISVHLQRPKPVEN
ncbi:MAG: HAMP domain-containing histidine kinase [Oscillospiraceae bacterium]|jgi:signal transduction histidine kinase|nr:HAMP domain-containing histidine kinase [Oscillospiraceae bacterium]